MRNKAKLLIDFVKPCPRCYGMDMRTVKTEELLWEDYSYVMECPCGFRSKTSTNRLSNLISTWNESVEEYDQKTKQIMLEEWENYL
jgi:hypothetical protein